MRAGKSKHAFRNQVTKPRKRPSSSHCCPNAKIHPINGREVETQPTKTPIHTKKHQCIPPLPQEHKAVYSPSAAEKERRTAMHTGPRSSTITFHTHYAKTHTSLPNSNGPRIAKVKYKNREQDRTKHKHKHQKNRIRQLFTRPKTQARATPSHRARKSVS